MHSRGNYAPPVGQGPYALHQRPHHPLQPPLRPGSQAPQTNVGQMGLLPLPPHFRQQGHPVFWNASPRPPQHRPFPPIPSSGINGQHYFAPPLPSPPGRPPPSLRPIPQPPRRHPPPPPHRLPPPTPPPQPLGVNGSSQLQQHPPLMQAKSFIPTNAPALTMGQPPHPLQGQTVYGSQVHQHTAPSSGFHGGAPLQQNMPATLHPPPPPPPPLPSSPPGSHRLPPSPSVASHEIVPSGNECSRLAESASDFTGAVSGSSPTGDYASQSNGYGKSREQNESLIDRESIKSMILNHPSPPPKPADARTLLNIESLGQSIAENGLHYEHMIREKEVGSQLGLDADEKPMRGDSPAKKEEPSLYDCKSVVPYSPVDSDMDMEDDITPSEAEQLISSNLHQSHEVVAVSDEVNSNPSHMPNNSHGHGIEKNALDGNYIRSGSSVLKERQGSSSSSDLEHTKAKDPKADESVSDSLTEVRSHVDSIPCSLSSPHNLYNASIFVAENTSENLPGQLVKESSPFSLLQEYASDGSLDDEDRPGHIVHVTDAESTGTDSSTHDSGVMDVGSKMVSECKKEIEPLSESSGKQIVVTSEPEDTSSSGIKEDSTQRPHSNQEFVEHGSRYEGRQEVIVQRDSSRGITSKGKEDIQIMSPLRKVDEFGRLIREGGSESDSEGSPRYYRRPRKRDRSDSRSRSPHNRRKVDSRRDRSDSRSRSPHNRRKGDSRRDRSDSRSRSPHNRRKGDSRSRSPHNRRKGDYRRDRSDSRSRSPHNRRKSDSSSRSPHNRRRRSPWSRKNRYGRSRSSSPKRRRNRSRSPPHWRGGEYGVDKTRREKDVNVKCFDFTRGKCYRGASCRYMHHVDKSERSRSCKSQLQTQELTCSSANSDISKKIETSGEKLFKCKDEGGFQVLNTSKDNPYYQEKEVLKSAVCHTHEVIPSELAAYPNLEGNNEKLQCMSVDSAPSIKENLEPKQPEYSGSVFKNANVQEEEMLISSASESPPNSIPISDPIGNSIDGPLISDDCHKTKPCSSPMDNPSSSHGFPSQSSAPQKSVIEVSVSDDLHVQDPSFPSLVPETHALHMQPIPNDPKLIALPLPNHPHSPMSKPHSSEGFLSQSSAPQESLLVVSASDHSILQAPSFPSLVPETHALHTQQVLREPNSLLPLPDYPSSSSNSANFNTHQASVSFAQAQYPPPFPFWNSLPPPPTLIPPPLQRVNMTSSQTYMPDFSKVGPHQAYSSVKAPNQPPRPWYGLQSKPIPVINQSMNQPYVGHELPGRDNFSGRALPELYPISSIPPENSFSNGMQFSKESLSSGAHALPGETDIFDRNQQFCNSDLGASRRVNHFNPYASTFERPISSKFSSNLFKETDKQYSSTYGAAFSVNHPPLNGSDIANVGSKFFVNQQRSAQSVQGISPRPGGDQYDPLNDSLEPTSNSVKNSDCGQKQETTGESDFRSRFSGSSKPLNLDEYRKLIGSGADSLEGNENGGTTADADVDGFDNESLSNLNDVTSDDTATKEVEIGQVNVSGKKKKKKKKEEEEGEKESKDSRSMRLFKNSLASFVKEVLKPSWRQGNMSKEVFKTIVMKTVDKVAGAMKSHRIPKSQAKINQFIDSSQRKLTKLVMGYVDKYVKV